MSSCRTKVYSFSCYSDHSLVQGFDGALLFIGHCVHGYSNKVNEANCLNAGLSRLVVSFGTEMSL
jgi:hypothetical protein